MTIGCGPQPNPNVLNPVAAHRKSSTLQQSSILKRNTTSESKRRYYTDRDEPVEAISNTPAVKETKVADPEAVNPEVAAAIEVESTILEAEEVKVGEHEAINLEVAYTCNDQIPEDSEEMEIKGHWPGITVTYRRNKYSNFKNKASSNGANRTTWNKSTRRYYKDEDEPDELKKMICWWHLRGLCKFGDDCWNSHDTGITENAAPNQSNTLQPFRGWAQ